MLVDPPRAGLEPETRAALAGSEAATVLYVSCDPATLARDAAELVAGGLRLTGLELFDLFPHTPHFETLALFER